MTTISLSSIVCMHTSMCVTKATGHRSHDIFSWSSDSPRTHFKSPKYDITCVSRSLYFTLSVTDIGPNTSEMFSSGLGLRTMKLDWRNKNWAREMSHPLLLLRDVSNTLNNLDSYRKQLKQTSQKVPIFVCNK